ncbi:hypothetical protein BB934_30075 (plasmid) [Microvirga ossetica]|uniref:DUF3563 domain-containing protein n=1 Tax=Microvirga ossetica TaxID=1882682 RepID=A0A1B2ERD6_9HYPH|nr:DUF3563 family protein [Microvirga ossetica]ANY82531.1 hypothetical protein BB934_30075 [Microvirga ossetica]
MILFSLCKVASFNLTHLPSSLRRHLSSIRQEFLPTDEERDAAHLASAADLHELEFRIREMGRLNRQRR